MDIKNKKQIYKKVQNSALNLLVWNNDLPDSIGSLNIKLTKEEIEKVLDPKAIKKIKTFLERIKETYEKEVSKLGKLSFGVIKNEEADVDKFCNNDSCEVVPMTGDNDDQEYSN